MPDNESNTCWRVADRILRSLKVRGKVRISIEKRLPVQGGLGAASSNAVATILALEKELKQPLAPEERLRIASRWGLTYRCFWWAARCSDRAAGSRFIRWKICPLPCVIATPEVGVSTPAAFANWDKKCAAVLADRKLSDVKLTDRESSDRINTFSRTVYEWLNRSFTQPVSGKGRDRPRHCFSTLSVPGLKTILKVSFSLSIPQYARSNVRLNYQGRSMCRYQGQVPRCLVFLPTRNQRIRQ